MPKISSLCIHFLSVIIVLIIAPFETKVSHEGEIYTSLSTSGPDKRNGIIIPERKEGWKTDRWKVDSNLFYRCLLSIYYVAGNMLGMKYKEYCASVPRELTFYCFRGEAAPYTKCVHKFGHDSLSPTKLLLNKCVFSFIPSQDQGNMPRLEAFHMMCHLMILQ